MSSDRRSSSVFANRILIGTVTALVLVLGVFFAYNSGSGLPFVPTYDINVQAPDAAGLIVGNEVTIGGARVGYVSAVSAERLASGRAISVLHLKLDKSVEPLPADSTDLVRPVSPLGLKYLEITRGSSTRMLAPGATIPISHTSLPVEIDDLFDMFTTKAQAAAKIDLDQVGSGFAGRGPDLNDALHGIEPLTTSLLAVTQNLMAPQTEWDQLFPSLEQAAGAVAPVARQDADLFRALDETFTPLSAQTGSLQQAISGGPPALRTATAQLPAEAQFVDDSTELLRRMRPAFANLADAARELAPAEAAGIPALRRSPQLNGRLVTLLAALRRFAYDGDTMPGLTLLAQTATLLEPTVAYITPAQTRCNYLTLFFRNLESAISESDSVGTELDATPLSLPQVPGSEAGPAATPADGPSAPSGLSATQESLVDDSYLHANPYPYTAAPGQPDECAAGNERYVPGRVTIGNPSLVQNATDATQRVLK